MKYRKTLVLFIVLIIITLISYIGYLLITRQMAINNFRSSVEAYLENKYQEEMYIDTVDISYTEGKYATAYPCENPDLSFYIREVKGEMIDSYLAICLQNELNEKIQKEILHINYNYKCETTLNGDALIKENLYDLYNIYQRPPKISELSQIPSIDHLFLSFENNDNTLTDDDILQIIQNIHNNFNDKLSLFAIYENGQRILSLKKQDFSKITDIESMHNYMDEY